MATRRAAIFGTSHWLRFSALEVAALVTVANKKHKKQLVMGENEEKNGGGKNKRDFDSSTADITQAFLLAVNRKNRALKVCCGELPQQAVSLQESQNSSVG